MYYICFAISFCINLFTDVGLDCQNQLPISQLNVTTAGMAAQPFQGQLACVVKVKCIKQCCSAETALPTADCMVVNGFRCRSCFLPVDQLVHILFMLDAAHSDPKFFHLLTPEA
jgi:hypothetical protein